ncbi:MAG: ROK family protein [Oscillospiraceae bacterium]|nr:ROK family protein [Oscillospiraceae bacterium]
MKIAALDLGGTFIKAAVVENGVLGEVTEHVTGAHMGGPAVIAKAIEIVKSFGEIDRVGLSTAGEVDVDKGMIRLADNIPGYTGMNLKKEFCDALGLPFVVENDVNAAAMGELMFGAGREFKDFLCVNYGTGIGGAVIINKRLYRGSRYSAGEFGGLVTHPGAMVPGDVGSGSYERYASTSALVRRALALSPKLDSGRAVFAAMDIPEVKMLVDDWIREISYGLICLIHTFNPSAIVLGGGIMKEPYIVLNLTAILSASTKPSFRDCRLLPAALGNNAGLLGAAHLASLI